MNVFELFGKIVLDNSGAERSLDNTVGHAKKAESTLTKTFKKIGTVIATAFAIDKIKDFGKACTEAYASIAAEESAFAQIMGDYADTAQQKLQAVADKTGVTSTRMTGAMTSLTAKFKGLGYGVDDATTLAADGLLIAADAAAFWDMSLDESMSHLNSFINGSYEGGEAIGLFANDTQMAAYAVEKGIVADAKAWATLDEATKQATRLDYAKNMQAQSGATGQSAKESASYANVMANLTEKWRQFQGVIGKPILEKFVLPAMQKLEKFMPVLTEAVQNGIEWLDEGFAEIKGYFEDVFTENGIKWDALPDAMSKTFKGIERSVGGWLSGVGKKMQNTWQTTVQPAIQNLASTFGIELPDIDLGSVFASFNTAYEEVKKTASKFYTNVKDAFAKDADGKVRLDEVLSGLFNAGVEAREGLLTAAGTLVADIYGKVTGNTAEAEEIKTALSGLFSSGSDAITALSTSAGELLGKIYESITGEEATTESIMSKVKGLFSAGSDALLQLTTDATGLMTNLANVIGDDTLDAGGKIAAVFNEGANAISNLLTLSGTLLSDIYEEITGDTYGATQIATLFSELFAPPETWKERMEKVGELFTPETFLEFAADKANENYAMYYRRMSSSLYAGGNIGEAQLDAWLNALSNPGGKEWSAAIKEIEALYWSDSNSLPWAQLEGIYNGRYVKNDAEKGEYGYYEWPYEDKGGGKKFDDLGSKMIDVLLTRSGILPDDITTQGGKIDALLQGLSTLKADVSAATQEGVAAGLSGVTITGYVTTGDVRLNDSTLIGAILPRIDLQLGWQNRMNGRGNA